MATGTFGKKAGNAIVPYSDTTQRTKQVDLVVEEDSGYPAVTTVTNAVAICYADSNGVYRLVGNFRVVTDSAATRQRLKIYVDTDPDIKFKNVASATQAVSVATESTTVSSWGVTVVNSNIFDLKASGSRQNWSCSFDVELEEKPSWFDDNAENTVDASIYIEPASASDKGVVNQGVAVSDAAGANPTKAEFDALLDSLRDAGIIAT